ncbi:HpcH/HpaI aldolase/citrate lyase family protein [Aldersonia sp. NBC_00410]|uniref:DUF6986 family protein n=1 Tax=Aldersonia sp. NBC_00410 TaxID=2975954 RepID=UPI0022554C72|nr:aldolase/citrate lyase family protein [Aldersonia sp. NBC_00410]MCX5043526.1 HpcH/HpaI aldolase/citrate lyase family protein [Aldersonia sp. NBC_00410]
MSKPLPRRIPPDVVARFEEILEAVDADLARHYPGDRAQPQPVHTVYVGAGSAGPETPRQWGAAASKLVEQHADMLADLTSAETVAAVRAVLARQPVQDLRIDFEDGYGRRADDVEDHDAIRAGATLAAFATANGEPQSCGVRIKGLTGAERSRALRTLELVLHGAGGLPEGFVFTIPKIRAAEQVRAAVLLCEGIEAAYGLPESALRFELQIESPQAILAADGVATVSRAIQFAEGRCSGLHYGTYDYSAALGIAAQHQALDHPVADHAKSVLQVAAAQTGVWVCDGSTQVLPVGSDEQVAAALRRHFRLVTRSLERGFYQGWDMHPGHLVTRWQATFAFFRTALDAAAPRLQNYLDRRGGSVVDEPATAEALSAVVLRGLDCGAFGPDDVLALAPGCRVDVLRRLRNRTLGPPDAADTDTGKATPAL